MTENYENACIDCNSKLYDKLEDECSVTYCKCCGTVGLNDIGLPNNSKYHNLEMATEAVFDTADKANKAMIKTFQGHFSPALWSKVLIEWHQNLHDEVIG